MSGLTKFVDSLINDFSYLRPDLLVRAARHYEGAFQVQVRKAVNTARQVSERVNSNIFIEFTSCKCIDEITGHGNNLYCCG